MLTEERYNRIVDLVNERGAITVAELTRRLGSSESTVRRDLAALDRAGKLTKVHGGAVCLGSQYATRDLAMDARYGMNVEEKRDIAAYAASLVEPDDFVYVDAGSTTELLCDLIDETRATYVTNSLAHAGKLAEKGCRVIVLGGELKSATRALVGPDATEALLRYHFTKGFWGTNGVGVEAGLTTPDANEAEVKRLSMRRCAHCYVLCDSSKFNQISPVTFAAFDDAQIVTSRLRDERLRKHANVIEVAGTE